MEIELAQTRTLVFVLPLAISVPLSFAQIHPRTRINIYARTRTIRASGQSHSRIRIRRYARSYIRSD